MSKHILPNVSYLSNITSAAQNVIFSSNGAHCRHAERYACRFRVDPFVQDSSMLVPGKAMAMHSEGIMTWECLTVVSNKSLNRA
jgi:hypothetical protein